MTTQTKTLTILGLAALAAGLFGTAQPATAAGLTHPAAFTRTAVIADHGDWTNDDRDNRRDFQREQDFRRDQILRRQEEFRREQEIRREEIRREELRREQDRRHDDRRDFQGDGRDFRDNR